MLSGVEYYGLLEDYRISDGDAVGCHLKCIRHEPGFSVPSCEQFAAMAYSYFPHPAEVDRRIRWLQSSWAQTLHRILAPYSVPLEICELIGQCCSLRFLAATAAREFCKKAPRVLTHLFDPARKVRARYVEFEGIEYIASLTNHPVDHSSVLIHDPDAHNITVDTLCMAEDYLGLRRVFFASSPAVPTVESPPGLWWTTISLCGRFTLEAQTDVRV